MRWKKDDSDLKDSTASFARLENEKKAAPRSGFFVVGTEDQFTVT